MSLKSVRKHLIVASRAAEAGDCEKAAAAIALALGLVDGLMKQDAVPIAAQLGRLGGTATAKRGPDYFRELAARRKTHGGGRPRKVLTE